MKLNVFYLFALILTLQLFSSCSKDDEITKEVENSIKDKDESAKKAVPSEFEKSFEFEASSNFESDYLTEQEIPSGAVFEISPVEVHSENYTFEINEKQIAFSSDFPGTYKLDVNVKVEDEIKMIFHLTFNVSPLTEKSFEFQGASRFHSDFFKEQGFTAADVFEISPQETESTNYFFEINEAVIVFDSPIVGAYKFNVTVNSDIVFHLTFNVTPILVNPYLSSVDR